MRSASIGSVVLSLVLEFCILASAQSKGPCTCQDIPDIEQRLKDIDETRAAWQQVLTETFTNQNALKTPDQARQAFRQAMGWGSSPPNQFGGLDPGTGEPRTDPAWESQHCDAVVDANRLHEQTHASDYRVGIPLLVLFGAPAKALALSEINARDKEEAFLEEKLEELRQKCGQWRCKCNGQLYQGASKCAASCPPPSLSCMAPTCYEIDPKTGKATGKAY
jgi:hypothetical protein